MNKTNKQRQQDYTIGLIHLSSYLISKILLRKNIYNVWLWIVLRIHK